MMHAYLEKPELPHIETASDNPEGILLTESQDFRDYRNMAVAGAGRWGALQFFLIYIEMSLDESQSFMRQE